MRSSRPARLVGFAMAVALSLGSTRPDAAGAPDRLDRFRELAASRLGLAQIIDDGAADPYREIYALLDEEIVESLTTGGVFASPEFLQDRLDAFAEAWGTAALRVARLGRLLVGAFTLSERAAAGNSVRVYGRLHDEPALLATLDRGGRPLVFPLAPGAGGAAQFVVAWEGAPSGRGTRALRLDHLREHGDGVRVVWSSADVFGDALVARAYSVRGAEIRVRYELHYPGWAPGCDGQTEGEDVYRLPAGSRSFVRVQRAQHNAWHRDLRAAAATLFDALAAGDQRALATVVPDPGLRSRLPAALRPEPACDAFDGVSPETVSIAASGDDRRPWSLDFRRAGDRWRLIAATPVFP
jgi:hypothetical protein